MELVRRFFDAAPDFREFRDDKPTLLVSWWCTVYAITVIFFRVIGRYIRTEKFYREDIIMLVAIFPLILRQALLHVVLLFGTNNTITDGLSASGISRRETGSKLVLATRILYVTYLWAIKLSTSTFLHNLTMSTASSHGKNQKILKWFYFFLFVTYVGTIVSVLGTCRPFSGYWQVIPDPGPQCRSGHEFLVTMGLSNGISNLALVLFPLPVIFASRLSGWQKFSILVRLALPIFSIIFTIYQVSRLLSSANANTQGRRSLLASLDILVATFIANAVVLVSLIRDRGFKKSKWKWEDISATNGNEIIGVRKVQVGWNSKASDWKTSISAKTYTQAITGGVDENSKKSWGNGSRKTDEEDVEMQSIGRARSKDMDDGLRMTGVERPEQARLLGEIRVAREWEVTTSQ